MHSMCLGPVLQAVAKVGQALSEVVCVFSLLLVELLDGHRPYPNFTAVPAAVTINIDPPTVS